MYYLRARFYNPVIGRFIQEDTYYGDGLNLYTYCHNNPVGYVDPSGHAGEICANKFNSIKYLKEKYKINSQDALNVYRIYHKLNPELTAQQLRELIANEVPYDPSTNKYPPRTPYAQVECQKVVDIANEILQNNDEENKKANKRLSYPVISVFTHENGQYQ